MKYVIILFTLIVVTACEKRETSSDENTSSAAGAIDEVKTKEVFDHHTTAFWANDLEATMADYTEESILITPDATYSGLADIRKNFEGAFAAFPKDSCTVQVMKTVIQKDVAYVVWQVKTPKFELSYATDSFIIRDGKILRQTYAGTAK